MHVRSNPAYSSLVPGRADGCWVIHSVTYWPTVGAATRRSGAFQTPRTWSACCTSSHTAASVRVANVIGADTYLLSGPSTRARNRPEDSNSTVPNVRRRRADFFFLFVLISAIA